MGITFPYGHERSLITMNAQVSAWTTKDYIEAKRSRGSLNQFKLISRVGFTVLFGGFKLLLNIPLITVGFHQTNE